MQTRRTFCGAWPEPIATCADSQKTWTRRGRTHLRVRSCVSEAKDGGGSKLLSVINPTLANNVVD